MAVWSKTSLAKVLKYDRIDGEYFLPAYLDNDSKLAAIKTFSLPEKFFVSDGNHMTVSQWFSDNGDVPYYRGQDVNDFFLENATPVRIPRRIYDSGVMRRSHFKEGDVLLSIVGTIGSLSVVPKGIGDATGSCKIAILRRKSSFRPFALAAFLASKYGQLQIKRNTRGAIQMGLILRDLSRIRVPDFPDEVLKEVDDLIQKAIKKNHDAIVSYSTAQSLLSSSLNEGKLTFDHPLSYTTKFSDVMREGRTDADYFQVPYVQLAEHIRGNAAGFVRLTEYCDFLSPNANPDKTPNEEFSYVELADINAGLGVIDVCEKYRGGNLPSRARRRVKPGDVLASSVVGSIDKSAVIGKDQEGFIASTGFFHLRPKGVPSEFLLMLMRSTIVQMQLRQQATGGILSGVPDARVRFIVVPKIDRDVQKEVAAKVRAAHKKHKESLALIAAAKARVEDLIVAATK